MNQKKRKLKAKTKVDLSGKAQVQYRDTPEAIQCLKDLGEATGMGPSGILGTLLRCHIKIPDDTLSRRLQETNLAFLTGLVVGAGMASEEDLDTLFHEMGGTGKLAQGNAIDNNAKNA